MVTHLGHLETLHLTDGARVAAGIGAGLLIGVIAAFMGIAGGELIIPAIMLLFALEIKLAGTLSLAISLPTMLVAFGRYSQDASFVVLRRNTRFVLITAAGSIGGTVVGGLLLGVVPSTVLIPVLAVILVISAARIWRHR